MGLFLDMSGVAGVRSADVEQVLADYVAQRGGVFDPVAEAGADVNVVALAESLGGHVTIVHAGAYTDWPDVSAYLFLALGVPVLSLAIEDGDFWMYQLFVGGNEVDRFNPLPDYYDDSMAEAERRRWAGSAATLAQHWPGVDKAELRLYLISWDDDAIWDEERKVRPEDRYPLGDAWQVVDFMERLGLVCPVDEEVHLSGKTFRFEIPLQPDS